MGQAKIRNSDFAEQVSQTNGGLGALATSGANDSIIQKKSGVWTHRTMAELKADLALVKGDVGLGNVDNTSDSTKNSATATLTNKRITKRVTSEASTATPTINTDNCDVHKLTALATNITSFTTNLSGTPTDWQLLVISIAATGTRTITWGTGFESGSISLPSSVPTGTTELLFRRNTVTSKWKLIATS